MSPSPADYNYLLKLLSLLIDKSGGELRISAHDLHNSEPPKGFTKRWDNDKRELVIESVSHGTALYLVNEEPRWSPTSQSEPLESKLPLTGTDPLQPIPVAQAAAQVVPFRPSSAQPVTPSRVVLEDADRQAKLESERAKQAALKQIMDYSSPEPAYQSPRTRHSTPLSSQPPEPRQETPPAFFKP